MARRRLLDILEGDRYIGTVSVRTRATTQRGLERAARASGRLYCLGLSGWSDKYTVSEAVDGIRFTV